MGLEVSILLVILSFEWISPAYANASLISEQDIAGQLLKLPTITSEPEDIKAFIPIAYDIRPNKSDG